MESLMRKLILATLVVSFGSLAANGAVADDMSMMDHAGHDGHAMGVMPTEPGQSAFAAIAEIVGILRADPATDWSKVDIGRLREHLVDMDELTLNARVETSSDDRSVTFHVSGEGRTRRAIQDMVPAHASVLASDLAMQAHADLTDDGATLVLTADNADQLRQYEALGFFGVMALGAHHQAHHLALARGIGNPHSHNMK
jgi:hypothetical protein